jgi:hypothetical protein
MQEKTQREILSESGYIQPVEERNSEQPYQYKVIDYQNRVSYEEEKTKERKTVVLEEKLVCTYSTKRALKDQSDRKRAIEKAEKLIRQQDHSQLKTQRGYKKYVITDPKQQENSNSVLKLDQTRIERESRFDGYAAIQYSRKDLSGEEVIAQYHSLYKIEESFRVLKSTMQTRPIYLRTPNHIEGHFVICFLSFLLQRELELRLRKRRIEFSTEKIKKAIGEVEFSEIEIEKEIYYLKGKHNKLASNIFSLLRIKQPKNLLTKEEAAEYIEQ